MKTVFLDTGPLVALLRERDQFHQWVKIELSKERFRFITCEAVLTETLFITRNSSYALAAISSMIDKDQLEVRSALRSNKQRVFELFEKYSDQQTSLADVCLLVLYESEKSVPVFTTDSDFLVYRDQKGNPLQLISPYKN
ncbi:MAG: PIN domain-containing protein [Gracilimonas sp.]|uniref:type II toxin-antitoxin system VapC family toxin n=1 Tax=Gracilimonas TaxID=649462 RepID=UPI001B0043FF|nr:PIN domain-containing protein [Gracilimonas sp.]MBO6586601.1 PIN domain-containing protein [Gracilimonas sp.]MBO6615258.1 PIN domain-containing protein [Gracilimonas sp.]